VDKSLTRYFPLEAADASHAIIPHPIVNASPTGCKVLLRDTFSAERIPLRSKDEVHLLLIHIFASWSKNQSIKDSDHLIEIISLILVRYQSIRPISV
jgi:hypothetical protein